MPLNPLSQYLLELADAIEKLAWALAQQKNMDNAIPVKELAVLQKKLKKPDKEYSGKKRDIRKEVKQKYKKGFLIKWLSDKGIYTGHYKPNLHVDKNLYAIADYLADHYFQLGEFYNLLKRHQNIKKDFVAKTPKQSLKYIRKWAEMLYKNKIIDAFSFLDKNKIDVDIAKIHRATYFINGQWLEIFLRREIALFMKKNLNNIRSFDILAQVEIVKPNNKTSELDLLIMINDKVYWFEAKSGRINEYYKIFKEHRRLLKLPNQRSFVLVPALHQNQAEALEKKSGMTLLYTTQLDIQLSKILLSNFKK